MLTIVNLVLRRKLPRTNGPDDVAVVVSDFLIEDMPLHRACELSRLGSTDLLEFVWTRGLRNATSYQWTVAQLLHEKYYYHQWEFIRTLRTAISQRDSGMVQWALSRFPGCMIPKAVVEMVASWGNLTLLQHFEADDREVEWSASSLGSAAENNHWDVVRWLDERVSTPETRQSGDRVVHFATKYNNLEELKWLVSRGFRVTTLASFDVNGDDWENWVTIVRYLLKEGYGDTADIVGTAIVQAAMVGDLEFLQWLVPLYVVGDANDIMGDELDFIPALEAASRNDRVPAVQWLFSHVGEHLFPDGPSKAMLAAVQGGALGIVQWLYKRYAHDSSVKLFRVDRFNSWLGAVMDSAAKHGHLDVLKYLHREALEAQQQDNEILLQSHQDLHCTYRAMDAAAANGHLDIVQWLHVNRSEGCTSGAMDDAAAAVVPIMINKALFYKKQLEIVQWLHVNRSEGCTVRALNGAATNGNLEMLQWLHENMQVDCTPDTIESAASSGHLDVVKWLYKNYPGCYSPRAMYNAVNCGHVKIAEWLQRNCSKWYPEVTAKLVTCNGSMFDDTVLRVVQRLLSNTKGVRKMPFIIGAVRRCRFELALYLHEQQTRYDCSVSELEDIRSMTMYWCPEGQYILSWLNETYPISMQP